MKHRKKSNFASKLAVFIILFVFVGSMFAITQFSNDDKKIESYEIDGYTFYKQQGTYATKIKINDKEYLLPFLTKPEELSDIPFKGETASLLNDSPKVYISYNPNKLTSSDVMLAYSELEKILVQINGVKVVQAFTEVSDPIDPNIPIRNCKDSTAVIELDFGETAVSIDGNCAKVTGADSNELLKAADKLAMHLAGIKV